MKAPEDSPNWVPGATLWDVRIADLARDDLVAAIAALTCGHLKRKVYYVNLHALNLAYCCPRFRRSLSQASLVFCDGVGVRVAAALSGQRLRHRNTPPDWLDLLAEVAAARGLSFFLLGDEGGVASRTCRIMSQRHPSLRIAGTQHGFFGKTGRSNDSIVSMINECAPQILLVGMGMPTQEFWVDENLDRLDVKVCITLGAAFRWYSGVDRRAPRWLTDHGLEWLSRLARHPVRHFRRYVVGHALFFLRLVKTAAFRHDLPRTCCEQMARRCACECDETMG